MDKIILPELKIIAHAAERFHFIFRGAQTKRTCDKRHENSFRAGILQRMYIERLGRIFAPVGVVDFFGRRRQRMVAHRAPAKAWRKRPQRRVCHTLAHAPEPDRAVVGKNIIDQRKRQKSIYRSRRRPTLLTARP